MRALLLPLVLAVACNGAKLDVPDDCEQQTLYYPDLDGDGLGAGEAIESCEGVEGYVDNADDLQPDCGTNDVDACGVCAGGDADMDCAGECFGEAEPDACGICSGGVTGRDPSTGTDQNGDGVADDCSQCAPEGEQRFMVQWQDVPNYDGDAGPYSFELVLHEGGDILLQYANLEPLNPSATVGVHGDSEEEMIDISYQDEDILDFPVIWLERDGDSLSWDPEAAPGLNWMNVEAVGQGHNMSDDSDVTIQLPFAFPFYGETYDALRVSSNGFVYFGSGELPDYRNQRIDRVDGPLIAVLWDDLNPSASGTIYTYADPGDCEVDCEGMEGGFADVDDCGVCFGGRTGLSEDSTKDCAGDCGGEAFVDDCRACVGGSTGLEPTEECPEVPDFIIDQPTLESSLYLDYIDVREGSCAIEEGCVSGSGTRKVVRFTTMVGNIGFADFYLGEPGPDQEYWIYSACHDHYHFEAYANYDLLNPQGEVVNSGHKNGWCLMDLAMYDESIAVTDCDTYNCNNQGVSMGCADIYSSSLDCQWIDVTDMEDGQYTLRVITNPEDTIEEVNYTNNTAEVTFVMEGESVTIVQ